MISLKEENSDRNQLLISRTMSALQNPATSSTKAKLSWALMSYLKVLNKNKHQQALVI
jgi:hypothetical protein